jgi:hypothetical protein
MTHNHTEQTEEEQTTALELWSWPTDEDESTETDDSETCDYYDTTADTSAHRYLIGRSGPGRTWQSENVGEHNHE